MAKFADGLTIEQIEFICSLGEKINQAELEKNELILHKIDVADELVEKLLKVKNDDFSAIDSYLISNPIDGKILAFFASTISDKTISEEKSIIRHKQLAKDPKQKQKEFVYECWKAWQLNPSQYKSKTAFANDMLTKFAQDDPEQQKYHLSSVAVITGWCRDWEKEKSQSAS